MQDLFIYVGLFFVLQTRVSSDKGVSLGCNDTVAVRSGESVTINCSIKLKPKQPNCHVLDYIFKSNNVEICNSILPGSRCKSDNVTYVSLTISEILHKQKIDVYLMATCGSDHRSVAVEPYGEPLHLGNSKAEDESMSKTPIIFLVVALICIVIVVYLICRKQTNRPIHDYSILEKIKGWKSDVQQSLNTEQVNCI